MTTTPTPEQNELCACAKAKNIPISVKHGVEVSNALRFHSMSYAKNFLQEVIAMRRAVPYLRFTKDLGHKRGMSAGRYPQKTAGEFLRLLHSVEANAQSKGLDISKLKITKLLINKASIPSSMGRTRHNGRRSNLEVEVTEISSSTKSDKKQSTQKTASVKP